MKIKQYSFRNHNRYTQIIESSVWYMGGEREREREREEKRERGRHRERQTDRDRVKRENITDILSCLFSEGRQGLAISK